MTKTSEFSLGSASSQTGSGEGPPSAIGSMVNQVKSILMRRWKLVAAGAVLCGVLAAGIALAMGQKIYVAEGTLLYTSPPAPESVKGVYTPPRFDTLKDLVTSSDLLEALAREQKMAIPPAIMKKLIKVDVPFNTEKVAVTLEWPDSDQGAEMVNSLMRLYIERVAASRKSTLTNQLRNTENNIVDCDKRLIVHRAAYKKLASQVGVANIKEALTTLEAKISEKERDLAGPRGQRENIQAQIRAQQKEIAKIKMQPKGGQPNEESKRRLKELESQLISQKGELEEAVTNLREAEQEYEITRKGSPSRAMLEKAKADADRAFTRKKTAAAKVKRTEEDIQDLKDNPGSQDLIAAQKQIDGLELQLAGFQGQIEIKEEELAPMRKRREQLVELQREAELPAAKVEQTEAEMKKLEDQKRDFGQLASQDFREFEIFTPAKASDTPAYSTAKKWAVPAFAIPFLLFVGLVVTRDLRSGEGQTEALAAQLGLPVLARPASGRSLSAGEARGLALRLRQYVSASGSTVLVSSLNDGPAVDDVVANVSRYLAMRDERVLILDARIAADGLPRLARMVERPVEMVAAGETSAPMPSGLSGLVQYLVFEGQDASHFIHPTGLGAVDYLPAGGPYPMTDVLATEPMKDLLHQLRHRYTVILLVGPSLAHPVDTEILAAYTNGMVVVLNGTVGRVAPTQEFIRSLREANVPLLGAVLGD